MTDTNTPNSEELMAKIQALLQEAKDSNARMEAELIPELETLVKETDALVLETDAVTAELDKAETDTIDQIDAAVLELVADETPDGQ